MYIKLQCNALLKIKPLRINLYIQFTINFPVITNYTSLHEFRSAHPIPPIKLYHLRNKTGNLTMLKGGSAVVDED
jgi:hypothetical protein